MASRAKFNELLFGEWQNAYGQIISLTPEKLDNIDPHCIIEVDTPDLLITLPLINIICGKVLNCDYRNLVIQNGMDSNRFNFKRIS